MSQVTLGAVPAFEDVPEDTLVVAQPLRENRIQAVSENAKYAVVHKEAIACGFFEHGDTIPLPVSPVDGYTYTRAEVQYKFMVYSTRAVAGGSGFAPGQFAVPTIASTQPGNLYWWVYDIDDPTGVVSLQTSYFVEGGSETPTNDGIIKVVAFCQRSSDNTFIGAGGSNGATGNGVHTLAPGATAATPGGGYTIQASDRAMLLLFDSGTSVAITIPDQTTPGFSDFYCYIQVNAPGDITINTVTDTISGAASFFSPGTNAFTVTVDGSGTNYEVV